MPASPATAALRRIDQPPHTDDEIAGHQRVTIRPAQPLTEPEPVFTAISGDRPRFRGRGHGLAIAADGGQTLEQIADDVERGIRACALRVE